eukprot:6768790-Prymnesium_polylepis.2
MHPRATLDTFVVSGVFARSIVLSTWLEVPEFDLPDGFEPGCLTTVSVGSTFFPNAPRGCVPGDTSIHRLNRKWRRVNVVQPSLVEGSKLSMGDIKGTVVIDEAMDDCDVLLSPITFMKKSATGLIHESICHARGVPYAEVSLQEVVEWTTRMSRERGGDQVELGVNIYIHDQDPLQKLSYVPDPDDAHLEGDGTSTFGEMNADQALAVLGPSLLEDMWGRSDPSVAMMCPGCHMLHHNCPGTCGVPLVPIRLPRSMQSVDACLGSSGYGVEYRLAEPQRDAAN